jgi:hypothetical protein
MAEASTPGGEKTLTELNGSKLLTVAMAFLPGIRSSLNHII